MSRMLAKNLAAMERSNATTARRLRHATERPDLTWCETKEQAPSAVMRLEPADAAGDGVGGNAAGGRKVTLASRLRPLTEAERLAGQVDVGRHGMIVVVGFGLGYHVRAVMQAAAGKAALLVYEPDESLLRAVLERVDASDLLGIRGLTLLTGEPDTAELTQTMERHATMAAQGVQLLTHPPTRQVHGEKVKRFCEGLSEAMEGCRMNLATTLAHAPMTIAHLARNIACYAAGASVNELKGAAAGRPAVLVAAGPSLAKNVHRLAEDGVRDRAVIIAAQTALKPLLQRGVRPHFVTALDYHEISRRFYDDLPPLPDVTLVAEPKANPVILDRYPGPVRLLQSRFLDTLLGDAAGEHDGLKAGSTVAHLSLYLAQYLGCDPIVLSGQDLGFSDGLYYCPGTAIHDVWAGELGMFNTLETMEWKRIARHKPHLSKRQDVHGRTIYTDDQMLTYLAQFERDFAAAEQAIIDATEGGLAKRHTQRMTLSAALRQYATTKLHALPTPRRGLDADRLAAATGPVRQRLAEVRQLQRITQQSLSLLERMRADRGDAQRMDRHFEELARHQQAVAELSAAFELVNSLNQVGTYNRMRTDRAIAVSAERMSDDEKQRRQIERDRTNLQWLDEACGEAERLLTTAMQRLEQELKRVSEETPREAAAAQTAGGVG